MTNWARTHSKDLAAVCVALGCLAVLWGYSRQPLEWSAWLNGAGLASGQYRTYTEFVLVSDALLLLPVVILTAFGFAPSKLGLAGASRRWWLAAGAMALFMVLLAWIVSHRPEFRSYYPLYAPARFDKGALLFHLLVYGVYLWLWEWVYRGVLTLPAWRICGWYGVIGQAVLFGLMHLGKPLPEVFGSFVAGVVLGWLAVRSGSFIPGAIAHIVVSSSMDLFVVSATSLPR